MNILKSLVTVTALTFFCQGAWAQIDTSAAETTSDEVAQPKEKEPKHKKGRGFKGRMSAEHKAAFKECKEATGMPNRRSNEKPTEEQRAAFEACLAEKNIPLPKHKKFKE